MSLSPTTPATAEPRPDPRVPAEFIGRARVLRERLALPAVAWAAGSHDLLGPLAGPNRTPYARKTLLARLPRALARPCLGSGA
jgi:hypothetical protein